jgi:L-serine/L-threonine ammonia-lyase
MLSRFSAQNAGLFLNTPVKRQAIGGIEVLFKLDYLQPSGSFKDRGIGHMIKTLSEDRQLSKLLCSSGGNAGLAVATAGKKLGLPVSVFVPTTTSAMMQAKIKDTGATVFVGGENWNAADLECRKALTLDPAAAYIPPFDHPLIWEGNSSIVSEVVASEKDMNLPSPDAWVVSVGGGGLLAGILKGVARNELSSDASSSSRVFALETDGAASFAAAKKHGKVVSLSKIDTVATSLGALAVTPATLLDGVNCESVVVSDKQAVNACVQFANDHRVLVEPGCGTALSMIYEPTLLRRLSEYGVKKVCIVVCGGSAVSLEMLHAWREKLGV